MIQRKNLLLLAVLMIMLTVLFTACGEDKNADATTAKDADTAAETRISSETAGTDSTIVSSNTDSSIAKDTADHLEDAASLAEGAAPSTNVTSASDNKNNGQPVGGDTASEETGTPAQRGEKSTVSRQNPTVVYNGGRKSSSEPADTQSTENDGDNVEVDINDLP